jgi:hypothetical protein
VGNGFVRIRSDTKVFVVRYSTCGKVQPLQSVKSIRIAVSTVLDELRHGHFNRHFGMLGLVA